MWIFLRVCFYMLEWLGKFGDWKNFIKNKRFMVSGMQEELGRNLVNFYMKGVRKSKKY